MADAESPTREPLPEGPPPVDDPPAPEPSEAAETATATTSDAPEPAAPAEGPAGFPQAAVPAEIRSAPSSPPRDAGGLSTQDRRRRVRWMDTFITLLLCGAAAAVLLVAAPPLLRAAGMGPTVKSSAPIDPARALRRPGHRDGQFFAGDDELDETPSPHRDRRPAWSDNDEDPVSPGERHGDAGVRVGLVRRPIKLFDHPGAEDGDVIGEVGSGETVMLVTEMGEWVLVVHSGSRDVSMGWTRKSDIAVR